jgi:uncharacterized OB-fold protein
MAHLIVLKCPNCGSLLEKGQSKCSYCGAELILLPDQSMYKFRNEAMCPKCGAVNEKSSWFCVSCSTVLTQDVEMLRELQKKHAFAQERAKGFMPDWMIQELEPQEYIYFVVKLRGEDDFYAVTDKRIIKSKDGEFQEARLSEAVSVGQAQVRTRQGFFDTSVEGVFEVDTFHGSIVFDGFGVHGGKDCGIFRAWVQRALENHNLRKKDARALLLNLSLDGEVGQKKSQIES